jgi:hypothetical protein
MRANVVAAVVLAAAIAGVLIGVSRTPTSPAPRPVVSNPSTTQNLESSQDAKTLVEPAEAALPATPLDPSAPAAAADSTAGKTPELSQAYIDKRVSELQDLSAENDAASLRIILSEVTNRNREIRHGAIEAAIQFGSREAVPTLLDAAAHTDDPAEKAELTEAADYLKLPSITEVLAKQQKGKTPAQTARHNFPSKKATPPPPAAPPQP